MQLYPRFTPRGRAMWLTVAVAAGAVGITAAMLRGDRVAAVLIAVALGLLLGIWLWGRGDGEGG